MSTSNLVSVPVGLLMVFDNPSGFLEGLAAMKLVRDIHRANDIGALSLPLDKAMQPRLDCFSQGGDLGEKLAVGIIDGEPVLFLDKSLGGLGIVVHMAVHLQVPAFASVDVSLEPQAGVEGTSYRLYELHDEYGFVIHVCNPQDAEMIMDHL